MDTRTIRCPSGLRGKVRKLKGRDFHRLLIDNPDDATPHQMADLAGRIWVETIDPGPYRNFGAGDDPPFRTDVLLGDRTWALLQSRILTDGGKRTHRIQCEGCKGWQPDVFDYDALDLREWPEANEEAVYEDGTPIPESDPEFKAWIARRLFANGEPCSTVMPEGGPLIKWRLLDGDLLANEVPAFAALFGDTFYADTAARIVSIDGVDLDGKDAKTRRGLIFDALTDFDEPHFWHLWHDMQDHEVGPETDIPKTCKLPGCECTFGYTVDIMGFIMPPPPKRWKRFRGGRRSRRRRT
jgi:hypothetical protein